MEKNKIYLFQLKDTTQVYEVSAEDAMEAFRKCQLETKWPIASIIYIGSKLPVKVH